MPVTPLGPITITPFGPIPPTTTSFTLSSTSSQAQATAGPLTPSITTTGLLITSSGSSLAQTTGPFASPITTSFSISPSTSSVVQATGSSTSSVIVIIAALLGAFAALSLGLIIIWALKRKRNNERTGVTVLPRTESQIEPITPIIPITPFEVERRVSSQCAKSPVAVDALNPNTATSARNCEQMLQIQHTPQPRGSVLEINDEGRVNLQQESRDLGRVL